MNINTLDEEATLSQEEIGRRHEETRALLCKAGAHYVIDSIADIESVVDEINARLARGEKP